MDFTHVHSGLALSLRYQYRELRDAKEADLALGVALAALYGHSAASMKTGASAVEKEFELALSRIPYYNIRGRNIEKERERGARLLRILNRNVTKDMLKDNG